MISCVILYCRLKETRLVCHFLEEDDDDTIGHLQTDLALSGDEDIDDEDNELSLFFIFTLILSFAKKRFFLLFSYLSVVLRKPFVFLFQVEILKLQMTRA